MDFDRHRSNRCWRRARPISARVGRDLQLLLDRRARGMRAALAAELSVDLSRAGARAAPWCRGLVAVDVANAAAADIVGAQLLQLPAERRGAARAASCSTASATSSTSRRKPVARTDDAAGLRALPAPRRVHADPQARGPQRRRLLPQAGRDRRAPRSKARCRPSSTRTSRAPASPRPTPRSRRATTPSALVRPRGEIQAGLVRFDTLITGDGDPRGSFRSTASRCCARTGRPTRVELDLGQVPRTRVLRAEGLRRAGAEIAWDEIQVNASAHRFRVRLVEPRRGRHYARACAPRPRSKCPRAERSSASSSSSTRRWSRRSTRRRSPSRSCCRPTASVAYVRAVAFLADGNSTEDLVFVNAPDNLEEIEVQFVELFTTRARQREPTGDRRSRPTTSR